MVHGACRIMQYHAVSCSIMQPSLDQSQCGSLAADLLLQPDYLLHLLLTNVDTRGIPNVDTPDVGRIAQSYLYILHLFWKLCTF